MKEFQNEFQDDDIFSNPEFAQYYAKEYEVFKNYLYKKYSIAIDSQDPIAAEYEILNNFFGKICGLKEQVNEAVASLAQEIDNMSNNNTAYYQDMQKFINDNNNMLKTQFSAAANTVANQLNKKVDAINEYKPSLPRSSVYLLSSVALLSIINILVLVLLLLK